MAKIIGLKAMNTLVSHMEGVRAAVHEEAEEGGRRAKANLASARTSTKWHKIHGPDHLTKVEVEQGEVDSFFSLIAPNPMAIEFGHAPSGVFGPGGEMGHIQTKAPHGLYILTHAAMLSGLNFVPATGRSGKG
ncbi:DUF5403 family protein [Mycobacterium paragordonae]|uniref:DUF5403 family protein n=1 Tax=Mycobacterium paragordonae TaxID=1389713 RepID=A0AAJ1RZD2_9MYCO|nr:DUF5403 family protein [Mycobacterium paragordonae]MDP7733642.1 DUF5403 family protein [Mycobacterium paragordonae]